MNYTKRIDQSYLETTENELNVEEYFGDWTKDINKLKDKFANVEPFEHVVIDNFLSEEYSEKLYKLFPSNYEEWYNYCNPIEVKYAFDNINILPNDLKNYFYYLSTQKIVNLFKKITNIENLEYDEYLHGAGLHSHGKNGRLNVHLDYEKHPVTGKERRLNIILFMSKDWDASWNGANELWDKDAEKCIKKTDIKFNRAIIFKTNEISWHGIHEKIICPEGVYRKSLAYYYVSPLNLNKDETEYRKKAKYIKPKNDEYNENMNALYKIRANRLITKDDMNELFPDWDKDK